MHSPQLMGRIYRRQKCAAQKFHQLGFRAAMRLIVSLPVCIVTGFGLGVAVFRGPPPVTPMAAAALRERERTTDVAASPDSAAATEAKVQRIVAAALRKGNQNERENEMYLAVEALTAEDFRRLAADGSVLKMMEEKLKKRNFTWTNRDLLSALFGRWVKPIPGGMIAPLRRRRKRFQRTSSSAPDSRRARSETIRGNSSRVGANEERCVRA